MADQEVLTEAELSRIESQDPQLAQIVAELRAIRSERDTLQDKVSAWNKLGENPETVQAQLAAFQRLLADDVVGAVKILKLDPTTGAKIGAHGFGARILAESFGHDLIESGGQNHLAIEFEPQLSETGRIEVLVRYWKGKTPTQLRVEAEKERDALKSELLAVRKERDAYRNAHATLPEHLEHDTKTDYPGRSRDQETPSSRATDTDTWTAKLIAVGLTSNPTQERVKLGAFLGDEKCRQIEKFYHNSAGKPFGWVEPDSWNLRPWLSHMERLAENVRTEQWETCDHKNAGPPLVTCKECGQQKTPWGRDAGPVESGLCDGSSCEGYTQPPKPSSLWPGETADDPLLGPCPLCRGTGQRYKNLRIRLLVRASVACGRLALEHICRNSCGWGGGKVIHSLDKDGESPCLDIRDTLNAADAWALDPDEEGLHAWEDSISPYGRPEWLPYPWWTVPAHPDTLTAAVSIREAARVTSESACKEKIQGLASWVMGATCD